VADIATKDISYLTSSFCQYAAFLIFLIVFIGIVKSSRKVFDDSLLDVVHKQHFAPE